MKLAYLEFNFRYYPPESDDYTDYTFRLSFDKLENMTIDENLQVCTAETIRGRNKTFNAYLKPKNITLSGQFGDYQTTNIELISEKKDVDGSVKDILKINSLTGKDKSNYLNRLFTSMVNETRLVNVKTFYAVYENYIINNFNLTYIDNRVISVELTLQEMLLRNLQQSEYEVPYQLVEDVDPEQAERLLNALKESMGNKLSNGQDWYWY